MNIKRAAVGERLALLVVCACAEGACDSGPPRPPPGDAQAELPGDMTPPSAQRPEVLAWAPEAAPLGSVLTVTGRHLVDSSGSVEATLGAETLTVLRAAPDRLEVQLPGAQPEDRCSDTRELVLRHEGGESAPRPVALTRPAPRVDAMPTTPAGALLRVEGAGLSGARVLLDGDELVLETQSDERIDALIPRAVPVGEADVQVVGTCGVAAATVRVLAAVPRIKAVEPPQLAPGGVAYIRAEFSGRDEIRAVRVGDQRITLGDNSAFAWPSYDETVTADLLAVRIPAGPAEDALPIVLEGANGDSAPVEVERLPATSGGPPTGDVIRIPPSLAASSDTFPLGTDGAEEVRGPRQSELWCYALNVSSGPGTCGRGTIEGYELMAQDTAPAKDSCKHFTNCSHPELAVTVCNRLSGSYEMDTTHNRAELDIQRGDVTEHYVGGWVTESGEPPRTQSASVSFHGLLVLRSTRTGLQLVIQHSPVRGGERGCTAP